MNLVVPSKLLGLTQRLVCDNNLFLMPTHTQCGAIVQSIFSMSIMCVDSAISIKCVNVLHFPTTYVALVIL